MQVLCGLQGIFLIFNCQTPGLSIARALTEQMGGSIDAEYEDGMILIHVHFPKHLL